MFLLFQQQAIHTRGYWLFTGTFPTQIEAETYAKEYFGTGTTYHICDQAQVPLNPGSCVSID